MRFRRTRQTSAQPTAPYRPAEIAAYGAAWRRGSNWPVEPNPIPDTYVSRGGYLWRAGERYAFDPSVTNPPLWWVTNVSAGHPSGQSAAAPSGITAVSHLPTNYTPGVPFLVSIDVTPDPNVLAYVVADQPPADWPVSIIDQGGEFDNVNKRVKWGPFFDASPRTLTYTVTPGFIACGLARFLGNASADGGLEPTTGHREAITRAREPVNYSLVGSWPGFIRSACTKGQNDTMTAGSAVDVCVVGSFAYVADTCSLKIFGLFSTASG